MGFGGGMGMGMGMGQPMAQAKPKVVKQESCLLPPVEDGKLTQKKSADEQIMDLLQAIESGDKFKNNDLPVERIRLDEDLKPIA